MSVNLQKNLNKFNKFMITILICVLQNPNFIPLPISTPLKLNTKCITHRQP